jgi:Tol biopolymer transport system component
MGEVYRARDSKLGRDVAIKVVLAAVANDPDRLARFSREAHVLASLNHPNIAHIHGLEDAAGIRALVMELVEGPTLADRIAHGAIPLDEALAIAKQIVEALEAAHEQGIVHRDLKPANIKVRADGMVKVLDFGLARAMDPAGAPGVHALSSPTISVHATQAGIILGTAAYMSPEQATGKAVDKRSDLWAFGVVLLEMLTGRHVFEGETVSHVLASVLKDDPDLRPLPANTPASIRRLLRRCLEKDRKRRIADASDARLEIEDALTPSAADAPAAFRASRWPHLLPWAVAALALALGGALGFRGVDRSPSVPLYASIDVPADYVLGEDDRLVSLPIHTPMAFTPDGRSLIIQAARAGKPQLFLRSLDRPDARPIAGTDDARVPFVSPDGKWIGYFAAGELRKIPIDGGEATTICSLEEPLGPDGAAWGVGDVIVFGDDDARRIMRVSAYGGTPVPATAQAPPTRRHVTPFFLPDGKRFLFADISAVDASDARLMVQDLNGGEPRLVVPAATDGRVLPSGQLAFMRLGTMMTTTFDVARAMTSGDAVVSMRGVMQAGLRVRAGANNTGAGMFAVSSLGTLAVIRGAVAGGEENHLIWVTRDGRVSSAEPTTGAPAGGRLVPRISPDRSRAIMTVITPTRWELWFADWTRNVWTACADCKSTMAQLTKEWSTDGRRLLLDPTADTLAAHTIDGSAPDRVLVREPNRILQPVEWLADGRIVYLSEIDGSADPEIRLLDVDATAGHSMGTGETPAVSPDGRWLAYTATKTGQTNVVVQAFPGPGSRTQVSAGGGFDPAWSADGRTLYYLKTLPEAPGSSAVLAVDIAATAVFSAGTPRELFRQPLQRCANVRCFDISPDGPRFLFRTGEGVKRASVTRMDLVLNWTTTIAKGR